jgi:hypothetical protein
MSRKDDELVAKELGWVQSPPDVRGIGWLTPSGKMCGEAPHYSVLIDSARAMEDWIEEKGPVLTRAYTRALCSEVGYRSTWTNLKLLWNVAHATPEQRCRAFLKSRGIERGE